MNKLKQTLEKILKKEEVFLDAETGELNYVKIKDSADKIDEKLIVLLADSKELKKKFFTKIKDMYVFNINDFKFFLDENKIDNSYTQYANRIGLSDGNELLENRSEVVLDFPFKDCVLEGGQSTEEGRDTYFEYEEEKTKIAKGKKVTESAGYKEKQRKREEIFFNQVLAHDEIDRLFDKKALVNWKRFVKNSGKNGEDVKVIKRDKDGLIRENLIIKGNNLLALHSLKLEFAGKIKLIYIDPPYNTGNDSFVYNDRFNHSTWLTFMKNRLEASKDLLREDGLIFIHCDSHEHSYLKVLADEIFNRDNYIETITVVNNPRGRDYGGVANMHEYIHIYKKSPYADINPLPNLNKNFPYNDKISGFETRELRNRNIKFNKGNRPNLVYPFYLNEKKQDENGFFEISLEKKEGWIKVMPAKSQGVQTVWRWGKEKAGKNLNINICGRAMKEKCRYQIVEKYRKNTRMARSVWFDKEVNSERGTLHLKKLFNGKVFDHPKPEETIKRVLEMGAKEGDIILDYHLGSGTTATTAHKMNLQYIGVEQMDYIENVAVERLRMVIKGEQGGVSKVIKWKGGGEFLYVELARWNERAKEEINKTKDLSELVKLLNTLYEKYFLNYNVRIKDFKEKVVKEENFKKLSLKEQKRMFLTMLDLNQMYVQESEMADKRFSISKEDQKLTKEFYKNK